ncbi:MAG: DnaJ C-terminal domain-containing protein [Deltaproteobacteria bacterium]
MAGQRDLYEVLGVSRGASPDELKTAYRRLARKHHPDVNPGDKPAEERFKEAAAAFEVLSDPEKRKLYDELGAEALKIGFDPEKAKAYREWRTGRSGGSPIDPDAVPFDLGDMFGDLFGGRAGPGRRGGQRAAAPQRGPDIEATLEIDLRESVLGASRELSFERPERCASCEGRGAERIAICPQCRGTGQADISEGPLHFRGSCPSCGGSGQVAQGSCAACGGSGTVRRVARLAVKVPRGAIEGTIIRLAGQGGAGRRGGPPGDLLLKTILRPHPLLRLDGRDLTFDLPVTVAEAMLGAEVRVPTFEGDVQLKVPAGSQSGRRLRLRGKGLPDLHGGRGDLTAVVQIHVPKGKGAGAKEAAQALDPLYEGDVREGLRLLDPLAGKG